MKRLNFALLLALSLAPRSFALIGGTRAVQWTPELVLSTKGAPSLAAEIFPSVVLLEMGCTGTVVGPRHLLLAAHCVVNEPADRALRPEFAPGQWLRFDTRVQWKVEEPFEKSYSHSAMIVRTLVHSSYLYAGLGDNFPENTGDITVFVLDRDIGTRELTKENLAAGLLPIADVDLEALLPNFREEKVVKLGYGCESIKSDELFDSSYWRLKYDAKESLPNQEDALRLAATYEKFLFKEIFDDFYWISKGYFFDEKNPGTATICPGDSGGPLYSVKNSILKVVGVNSRSRLGKIKDGVSAIAIDFHTRLDKKTPLRIDRWLEEALKYPTEKWYQGVAYSSVVPRAVDFKGKSEMPVREDLRIPSRVWLGYIDGINGTCPLKFGRVRATDSRGREVALKHTRHATQIARLESADEITPTSFKLELLPETVDDQAGLCYLSILALE